VCFGVLDMFRHLDLLVTLLQVRLTLGGQASAEVFLIAKAENEVEVNQFNRIKNLSFVRVLCIVPVARFFKHRAKSIKYPSIL